MWRIYFIYAQIFQIGANILDVSEYFEGANILDVSEYFEGANILDVSKYFDMRRYFEMCAYIFDWKRTFCV